jgi:ATP-dependent DNA ligase
VWNIERTIRDFGNFKALPWQPSFPLPIAAVPAAIPRPLRVQIVSPCAQPPDGDGWLHKIKHDGHRLLAIVSGGDVKLISRNGHDRAVYQSFGRNYQAACPQCSNLVVGER